MLSLYVCIIISDILQRTQRRLHSDINPNPNWISYHRFWRHCCCWTPLDLSRMLFHNKNWISKIIFILPFFTVNIPKSIVIVSCVYPNIFCRDKIMDVDFRYTSTHIWTFEGYWCALRKVLLLTSLAIYCFFFLMGWILLLLQYAVIV